jgi:hypothetical protein
MSSCDGVARASSRAGCAPGPVVPVSELFSGSVRHAGFGGGLGLRLVGPRIAVASRATVVPRLVNLIYRPPACELPAWVQVRMVR